MPAAPPEASPMPAIRPRPEPAARPPLPPPAALASRPKPAALLLHQPAQPRTRPMSRLCASHDSLQLAHPVPLVPRAPQHQRRASPGPRRTHLATPAPLSLISTAVHPQGPPEAFLKAFCEACAQRLQVKVT
mgnify:CR=1 FL=1